MTTKISETTIKVRGYHIDLYGHVNNARYLEFLEEARWDYIDKFYSMETLKKEGTGLFLANIEIKFATPATLNDDLNIKTYLKEYRNSSMVLKQEIYKKNGDKMVLDAILIAVTVDIKTGKPKTIPQSLKELL